MSQKYNAIALLDRYIITQFSSRFIFSLVICTILSELIGISFEQIKFVTTEDLPITIMAWVHYYKLPAFFILSLPLSILMATIITYGNLAAKQEIVALQSVGIRIYRIVTPVITVAIVVTLLMFALQELIVPEANYQAAMLLEQEWGVDRTQLAKYNKREIVYRKFTSDPIKPSLEFLFFANRFDGQQMQNVTLLKYHQHRLQIIIVAQLARWNEVQQLWELRSGQQYLIGQNGFYQQVQNFRQLSLKLSKDLLEYANHHRDLREMNLQELYHRQKLINQTNDRTTLKQINTTIQERYAFPVSCLVFACLGAALGISTSNNSKSQSLAIAAIAILVYYGVQFLATVVSTSGIIPVVYAVWLPNVLGLSLAYYWLTSNR